MITRGNRYYRQLQLLVRVLPYVAEEQCFALKGGTAINLFFRDLPRLSVDIDLAYCLSPTTSIRGLKSTQHYGGFAIE